jgi:hypothetical protein
MTLTSIHGVETETQPDSTELLIKEARLETRHRRLRIVLAVLIVFTAAVAIRQTGGGVLHPVASPRVGTSKPKGNAPTRSAAWSPGTHFALPSDIAVSGSHAWVTNDLTSMKSPLANSVTELNVSNGSIVRVIRLSHIVGGIAAPNSIAASGTHVWVTDLNRIIELNASNGSVVRVIKAKPQFHAFERPAALFAITASGSKVWVANLNSVIEINASNGSVVRVIKAKADRFSMPIDIAASGTHVWVMNNVQPGRITELNASDGSLVRVISTNASSGPNVLTARGSHVWVANDNANSVIELNAANGLVTRVIKCCAFAGIASPSTIAMDGTHLWVTTNLNSVIEINAGNGLPLPLIKTRADGFEYSPTVYAFDAVHVWVVNTQSNSVTELRASNGSLVRLIK